MKTVKTQVQFFQTRWLCEKCPDDAPGEMKQTGIVMTSYPARYEHKCDKCGFTDTARGVSYPLLQHEPVPEREKDANEYAVKAEAYTPGDWYQAENVNDMQQFFLSRLDAIRAAARLHGYAIGAHGSMRRDMDLIAVPWVEDVASPDVLAKAIAHAACGIVRAGPYEWEKKPHGRIATSIPVCWVSSPARPGDGHIDLSIVATKEPKEEHHAG